MKIRIDVRPFEMIPKYYGLAYQDISRDIGVFYPIGLHWIVRISLTLYRSFRIPGVSKWELELENVRGKAFHDGYKRGWKDKEDSYNQRWGEYLEKDRPKDPVP